MEQKPPKIRLRLNLFDTIVLIIAVAAAALLAWMTLSPVAGGSDSVTAEVTQTVRYTVCFQCWAEGTSSLIRPGDRLAENSKNLSIGQVVSVQAVPARVRSVDQEARVVRWAELEGKEDVLVTIEATCAITDESITTSGSYELRVGQTVYVKGAGYLGSGPIVSIEEVQG